MDGWMEGGTEGGREGGMDGVRERAENLVMRLYVDINAWRISSYVHVLHPT